MHQNTNPVVIQDKNGKTTTVHRKNVSNGAASGLLMPAPTIAPSPVDHASKALATFSSLDLKLERSDFGENNIKYLAEASPKLLDELVETVAASTPEQREVWNNLIGGTLMHKEYEDEEDTDYRGSYARWIKTLPLGFELFPDHDPMAAQRRIRNIVTDCERKMGWRPLQKNYKEVQAAMIAVVAGGNDFEFKGRMYDIFFMADKLDEVRPLIPAILKRGETSREYIEILLDNASSSLSEGVL